MTWFAHAEDPSATPGLISGAMRGGNPESRKAPDAMLVRPAMPHTDLVAPSAQSEAHVSDGVYKMVSRIYDPLRDPDGRNGIAYLKAVVSAVRELEEGQGGRYGYRRAARRTLRRQLKHARS